MIQKTFSAFIFAIVAILIFAPNVLATEIVSPAETMQGTSIVIDVPAENFKSISGTLDGQNLLFGRISRSPDETEYITRAEFLELMFLNNDFGETGVPRLAHAEDSQPFPDVNLESPYYEYIAKAKNLGIVSGYEDGNFYPHALITRGQAAKMLVEAFSPAPAPTETAAFPDVDEEHVFFNYINDAVSAKWFKGYPDGLMRPDRNINFLEANIVVGRAAIPELFTENGEKDYFRAYAGIHRLTSPGVKQISLTAVNTDGTESKLTKDIVINKRPVRTVSFTLPKEDTDLFGDDPQAKTWDAVYGALANPTTESLWDGPFIVPARGEITLGFGDVLYINGVYSGSHFGIDYANNEGTPVSAANTGRVTLAEYTPAFGNTVVIDHGMNVFTMYLHMSELKVFANDTVEKGDLIGLMGSTGISSGDHLHYTMFIGDVIVDSEPWTGL